MRKNYHLITIFDPDCKLDCIGFLESWVHFFDLQLTTNRIEYASQIVNRGDSLTKLNGRRHNRLLYRNDM